MENKKCKRDKQHGSSLNFQSVQAEAEFYLPGPTSAWPLSATPNLVGAWACIVERGPPSIDPWVVGATLLDGAEAG